MSDPASGVRYRLAILGLALCLGSSSPASPVEDSAGSVPLNVLVISGRNNHDWRHTTPELVKILSEGKRFRVEVTEDPARFDAARLSDFDLVLSNWTAWPQQKERAWGEAFETALLDLVRSGKGLALVHAASTCFADWPQFHRMAGATSSRRRRRWRERRSEQEA